MDEGNVKYNCHWLKSNPILFDGYEEINKWRDKLYQLGLIGAYPNKIGFGNISIRMDNSRQFYITGAGTGGLEVLNEAHYARVMEFDFESNSLTCQGPIKASAESLTHAAVYLADPQINAVIHIHHLKSWEKLFNKIPTSSPDVAFGTVEMALEISGLFRETNLKSEQILIMGGHNEGIISFGKDLDEAGRVLLTKLGI